MSACSFYGKPRGLVWHLTPAGYPACTGGTAVLVSAGTALALWSTISLTCQLLYTFKSYRSLYFWSLGVTSWALSLHAIGMLLLFVDQPSPPSRWRFYMATTCIGWIGMTTGFSMVLYSRLHLIDATRRWRRALLMMIIVVAVVVQSVSVIMETVPTRPDQIEHIRTWLITWSIWHRVQPCLYLVVDFILTSLYVKAALEFIQVPTSSETRWLSMRENRQVALLTLMQVVVWMLDLATVGCALARLFSVVEIVASFVYAVKLKLEFVFLTQLVELSGAARPHRDLVMEPTVGPFVTETAMRPSTDGQETLDMVTDQACTTTMKSVRRVEEV